MFEGLAAKDELLLAEVKMQVLMYASIFEATIHYVLFNQYYKNTPTVQNLLTQKVNKLDLKEGHSSRVYLVHTLSKTRRGIYRILFRTLRFLPVLLSADFALLPHDNSHALFRCICAAGKSKLRFFVARSSIIPLRSVPSPIVQA